MNAKEFVEKTIEPMEEDIFDSLKEKTFGEYLPFAFFEEQDITKDVFAEKLVDYFEKLSLKNNGDNFDKAISNYISSWKDIVLDRIAKEPHPNKGEVAPPPSRANKYYYFAMKINSYRQIQVSNLMDFSRIMMCLYSASIKNNNAKIKNFDYSSEGLNIDSILSGMKKEENSLVMGLKKRKRFDYSDLYCYDSSTFILTIIMFFYIKNLAWDWED